ncbi:MAG: alpha-amylase family glycosyl hydrolase [Bacteroidales bacterium]|nr:alpha-amylase family glycosyl hydrolase [Bacteroidales bacterium]
MRRTINIFFAFQILLIGFYSCNNKKENIFDADTDPLYTITTPILLKPTENIIALDNFIKDFANIDSIYYTLGKFIYNSKLKTLEITSEFNDIETLSSINIVVDNKTYSIVCRKSDKTNIEINFVPKLTEEISDVKIAGDFNDWNPDNTPMQYIDNCWKSKLTLDKGIYQYQLIVDSVWKNNYPEGDTVSNGIGGYNTLLLVKSHCNANAPQLFTYSHNDHEIIIETNYTPDKLFILWQNQFIPIDLNNFDDNKYRISIPEEAKKIERSNIRVYSSYKGCQSNDLLIPLKNGKVIASTQELSRNDKHYNIMYFMLVDRFYNNCVENDKPVNDNRLAKKANYQGGDLQGINKKLETGYFDDLGINCLWISPIFQNPLTAFKEFPEPRRYYSGYHGYWPISSIDIDTRFGNDSVFKNLVDNAHTKNINVILDFVANHVHQEHPLYQLNKSWATDLNLPDGRKNIRIWDECRLTTWFDTFLPSWDFNNPEVTDTISELAIYWIKKFDIDGFRHDATKHIPEVFWTSLTKKLRTNFPEKTIYQIGETFGSRELINNYVGSDKLDGQFDFNLYFDARNCFADSLCNMKNLAQSLTASLSIYGYNNLMGNITGNHDIIRFITYADKSVLSGEDDKEAGWTRDISVKNKSSYKKLQNLAAFTMSIPGIPCIYYGDEIGMPGAGDPDNRRMMVFNNLNPEQVETFEIFKKLIAIRKENIEFIYGATTIICESENSLILKRQYFDKVSYLLINQSANTKEITLNKNELGIISDYFINFNSKINELSSNYQIVLAPYSFEILTKN